MECQFEYDPRFIVYDTPGTTAVTDKIQHAIFLKNVLTIKQFNAVFILMKYENRFQDLIVKMKKQLDLLLGYSQSVVFLISHIEIEKDYKYAIKSINDMLT